MVFGSSKLTAIPVLVDNTSFTPFGKINEKQIESNNNYLQLIIIMVTQITSSSSHNYQFRQALLQDFIE